MRNFVSACLFAAAIVAGGAASTALANADDDAWIAKCVKDNADQKQTPEVISKYCTCMNGKMTTAETLSITAWEKLHPDEEKACSKDAGWQG